MCIIIKMCFREIMELLKNWWDVCGKQQLWLHAIFVEKLQKAGHNICILIVIQTEGIQVQLMNDACESFTRRHDRSSYSDLLPCQICIVLHVINYISSFDTWEFFSFLYFSLQKILINYDLILRICGPDSVVGIATAYGLDGPGIESR